MSARAAGVACMLALAAAHAPARAENFAARAAVDAVEAACRAAGGSPQAGPGTIRDVRIGGADAVVVDFQPFLCKGSANPACGPFGCQVRVFLGASTTAAFEGQVRAWRVRGATFQVTRVGAYCANTQTGACSETHALSGGRLALSSRGAEAFARDPWRPAAAPSARPPRAASRPVGTRGVRGRIAPDSAFEPPVESAPAQAPAPSAQSPEERRRTLRSAPLIP